MKLFKTLAAALAVAVVTTGAALAQVNVMIPAGTGGGWDTTARQAFQALNEAGLYTGGVNFTNKGGAGGTIGLAEFLQTANGQPDSLAAFGAITVGAIELNKSPIKLSEFRPVARLTAEYLVIAVAANSEINTLADLAAALKANPGATTVGGGSAGGVDQISLALFAKAAGVPVDQLNYLPQTSGAETVTGIVNGTLVAGISGTSEFAPFAEQGRIKLLAVTAAERRPSLPDVPTFKESGFDVELANWRGILASANAPEENYRQWIETFTKLHDTEAWKKVLATQGWDDFFLPGDEFGAFIASETERQGAILRDAGLVN